MRVKVEYQFRVIKRQFGYTKLRDRGLAKNAVQVLTLFALSNMWMARRRLLTAAGSLRVSGGGNPRELAISGAIKLGEGPIDALKQEITASERVVQTILNVS